MDSIDVGKVYTPQEVMDIICKELSLTIEALEQHRNEYENRKCLCKMSDGSLKSKRRITGELLELDETYPTPSDMSYNGDAIFERWATGFDV